MRGRARGFRRAAAGEQLRVPLSPAVVRRIVDRLEPFAYDRLYTLGGDEIDRDAKEV